MKEKRMKIGQHGKKSKKSLKDVLKFYRDCRVIKKSGLFDEKYYVENYKDALLTDRDPIKDFLLAGWKNGANPSAEFNVDFYLSTYPDLRTVSSNPLVHYILHGRYEGRLANAECESYKRTKLESALFAGKRVLREIIFKSPKLAVKFFEETKKHGVRAGLLKSKKKIAFLLQTRTNYKYVSPRFTPAIEKEIKAFEYRPKISIVMPVYNVDPKWLKLAILSVQKQWYGEWELCIADDNSSSAPTIRYLKSIKDEKIKIVFLSKNLNISGATNEAMKIASGEYIAFMDHDDELSPDALYEIVKTINKTNAEFVYSDEDKISESGVYEEPNFKPDFSPDMLLSQNYINHFVAVKKTLLEKVGEFRSEFDGAQDYDLFLRATEHTDRIAHIQKVLYHWRKAESSTANGHTQKPYSTKSGKRALEDAFARRGIGASVIDGNIEGVYRIAYEIVDNPLVSIVIPFKDKPELLRMCIESIVEKSTYLNYEIIGISNNSQEKATYDEMDRLSAYSNKVKFHEYNEPFNYSAINNFAVEHFASGKQIVLLNNDIEIISNDWIEEMLMFSQREDVGCVGAKLYYPNNLIQHAGVIIGLGGLAGHSHKHYKKSEGGYFARLNMVQNLSAVTAACLMVKRSVYEELGGLDENLKVAFNDVDFCLRARERGYLNIFTPYCEAYHHESISRGYEDTPEKRARFEGEVLYMQKRHYKILQDGDPYYNPNLTLDREDFGLR